MAFDLKKTGLGATLLISMLLIGGCYPPRAGAPLPPHPHILFPGDPLYGHYYVRTGYRYRYYPGAEVYYDSSRGIYFYFSSGVWLSAPVLPPHIHIDRNRYVPLKMDSPKPYRYHRTTIKRYPRGQRNFKRQEQPGRQRQGFDDKNDRREERIRLKEDRKEERVRRKELHEDELRGKKERREDLRKERIEDKKDRDEDDIRGKRPVTGKDKKGKRKEDQEDDYKKNREKSNRNKEDKRGGPFWR